MERIYYAKDLSAENRKHQIDITSKSEEKDIPTKIMEYFNKPVFKIYSLQDIENTKKLESIEEIETLLKFGNFSVSYEELGEL